MVVKWEEEMTSEMTSATGHTRDPCECSICLFDTVSSEIAGVLPAALPVAAFGWRMTRNWVFILVGGTGAVFSLVSLGFF